MDTSDSARYKLVPFPTSENIWKEGKHVWLTCQKAYDLSIQIGSTIRSCDVNSGTPSASRAHPKKKNSSKTPKCGKKGRRKYPYLFHQWRTLLSALEKHLRIR
ncbi:hypothetical protein SUGI_1136890 [Cryptomeria japonica]|nr:hypothetical protein SUGI_1136890 [Cryptomeria japonica]